jgi:hypothetical protein
MISAGLLLVQCLDILAKQTSSVLRRVISEVTREVEAGSTLSDALGRHRTVFDDLFRNMVAAGEAGGVLDDPDAARDLHREGRRPEAQDPERHGYPAVVHGRGRRHDVHADLHHPDLRQDVHRLRRRAAAAD